MPNITIGRLRGGVCVTWGDDGTRHRHQLAARNRKEAEAEAIDVYRRETSTSRGLTIAELWERYLDEREGRPIDETMTYTAKPSSPISEPCEPTRSKPRHVKPMLQAGRNLVSNQEPSGPNSDISVQC